MVVFLPPCLDMLGKGLSATAPRFEPTTGGKRLAVVDRLGVEYNLGYGSCTLECAPHSASGMITCPPPRLVTPTFAGCDRYSTFSLKSWHQLFAGIFHHIGQLEKRCSHQSPPPQRVYCPISCLPCALSENTVLVKAHLRSRARS